KGLDVVRDPVASLETPNESAHVGRNEVRTGQRYRMRLESASVLASSSFQPSRSSSPDRRPAASSRALPRATAALQTTDGAPADPPTLTSAVPNWSSGDTMPLGAGR